jgi:hypothetical protein
MDSNSSTAAGRALAELVRLSKTDIAEEMREQHRRQVMGE